MPLTPVAFQNVDNTFIPCHLLEYMASKYRGVLCINALINILLQKNLTHIKLSFEMIR